MFLRRAQQVRVLARPGPKYTTHRTGSWATVRDYIHRHYKPYLGDASFLSHNSRVQTSGVPRRSPSPPTPLFDANIYGDELKRMKSNKVLHGESRRCMLPELARVPLFGADILIQNKLRDLRGTDDEDMTESVISRRQELCAQVASLEDLRSVATSLYGVDISRPAASAREAVLFLYVAYLATITTTGTDVSLGRVDAFLDTYIEEDISRGFITEEEAQELIDELVSYTDASITVGGMTKDGVSLVTKTSFRFLQSLHKNANAGDHIGSQMTVLWATGLSDGWKRFCIDTSIKTGRIQYLSDELARQFFGDNAGVVQGTSVAAVGTTRLLMAGTKCDLMKTLLYALNNGVDEITGEQVGPRDAVQLDVDVHQALRYDDVVAAFQVYVTWMAKKYATYMNISHAQQDRWEYDAMCHALQDTDCNHIMVFSATGLQHIAHILGAIRHAEVFPVKDERGLVTDLRVGQGHDRGQSHANLVVGILNAELSRHYMYRDAKPVLTVSCEKDIAYVECLGGIHNVWGAVPSTLGDDHGTRVINGVSVLDAYFGGSRQGFHLSLHLCSKQCTKTYPVEDLTHDYT